MAVPNASMAGREPPHMGPVAHGVAVLGDAAQRAVSQLAALAADAVQAPSRLNQAAALLTDDGRVGTVWQVTALFGGLLLGAIGVAQFHARIPANNATRLSGKGLALLRDKSVSGVTVGTAPAPTGDPPHAHLHHRQ